MQEGYALKQVSEVSRVQPRTLQFWTSNTVIRPISSTRLKGPGRHRRYPKVEVQIAALLGEVKALGVQVGTLQDIAEYLRKTLLTGQEFGFEDVAAARAALDADLGKRRFRGLDRRRIRKWIAIQEAIHVKTKTMLGLTIEEEGCTAVIFKFETDMEKMTKAVDSLLGRGAKILISIGAVLYDVECELDPEFVRGQ